MNSSERYRERRAKGLCGDCGGKPEEDKARCVPCRDKLRARSKAMKEGRAQAGQCVRCERPSKKRECSRCMDAGAARQRNLRAERARQGVCSFCGGPAVVRANAELKGRHRNNLAYCFTDYLKDVADRHLGSRGLWRGLAQLWERQQGRCIYTGEVLVLGDTAHVDHRIPRVRGGTNAVENLQWVSARVNRMKTDYTHEEFLAACSLITQRFATDLGHSAPSPGRVRRRT